MCYHDAAFNKAYEAAQNEPGGVISKYAEELLNAATPSHARILAEWMLNHQLAKIHHELGKETGSKNEKAQAHRIARTKTEDPAWSFIRGSKTDCIKIEGEKIHLAIPFVYSIKDKELRIREYIGRIMFYKLFMEQCEMKRKIHFEVLCEKECDQLKEMVKKINESI